MKKGIIEVYCGTGKGKSAAAIGRAIQAVSRGQTVIAIQFLKGKDTEQLDFLDRLEPEMKLFRFEKNEKYYEYLSAEERQEENRNIRNGLNFARKVLATEECDLLVLDEILGVLELGIISADELKTVLAVKDKDTEVLMTGNNLPPELESCVDVVTTLNKVRH